MSDYFVKEIRAIQYKNDGKSSNKNKVNKFVKSIVGDAYYVEEDGYYIKLLRTFDKSNVIGNFCNVLWDNDYLVYDVFNKKFSIITGRSRNFNYLPKEEYLAKNKEVEKK